MKKVTEKEEEVDEETGGDGGVCVQLRKRGYKLATLAHHHKQQILE